MKIEVCLGQHCKAYGGSALVEALKKRGTAVTITECRSLCPHAPVIFVNDRAKLKVQPGDISKLEAR